MVKRHMNNFMHLDEVYLMLSLDFKIIPIVFQENKKINDRMIKALMWHFLD